MKAFIFNSGTGSRMGKLTNNKPKGLVEIGNGETMLSRQIRQLKNAGIKHIIITTGPFEEQIKALVYIYPEIKFEFVENAKYNYTNSIYSLYLAKNLIDDDLIILHGDLVFDSKLLEKLVFNPMKDICLINKSNELSKKDFKGRIQNNYLQEIAVSIFDDNCYNLQPLYKFSKQTMKLWLDEIERFIENGLYDVYAENALNIVLPQLNISYIDYNDFYIEEIDNQEDLIKVSKEFRFFDYKNQTIIHSNNYIDELRDYIRKKDLKRPMIVCSSHILADDSFVKFKQQKSVVVFNDFSANPTYEEVLVGLKVFKENNCDSMIGIGGGSALDVAKAIKLYSPFEKDYINKPTLYVDMPLLAIPTTAGTGSESTRYSVLYFNNEKQSLVHDSILPDTVILDKSLLYTIPEYHQKATLLDAFCQAVESFWSINSTIESKRYSRKAINLILENYKEYLGKKHYTYESIFEASNLAGKAINITQTTAPHAMSYKITSETGVAHGHAVAIMLVPVLKYMINNIHLIQDIRGEEYVYKMFDELIDVFKCKSINELTKTISEFIEYFDLNNPKIDNELLLLFANSVNQTRLKNSPIKIDSNAALEIYKVAFNL
jgi:alcohol dehydrogenase class IV/GTP:adenosylcobinamide-phosphate guanylyltransferase